MKMQVVYTVPSNLHACMCGQIYHTVYLAQNQFRWLNSIYAVDDDISFHYLLLIRIFTMFTVGIVHITSVSV